MKIQMFLSTALTMWDADFYVKADDNVHVNIGMQRRDPFNFDQSSIVPVHHTVIGGLFQYRYHQIDFGATQDETSGVHWLHEIWTRYC